MALTQVIVLLAVAAFGQSQLLYSPAHTGNLEPERDYAFNYQVADPLTGDVKDQQEVKTNGVVQGGYSLIQPDGSLRQVTYVAAPGSGFNAIVKTIPGVAPPNAPVRPAHISYAPHHYDYPYAYSPYHNNRLYL